MTICGACSTLMPPKPIPQEQIIKQDNALGLELARQFEEKLTIKRDRGVENYLADLAEKLSTSSSDLKQTRTAVLLIRDHEQVWDSYSLPGNRVYLSLGFVKSVEFENELAAVVALELGHIARRHAMIRLQKILGPNAPTTAYQKAPLLPELPELEAAQKIDFTGPAGLFEYNDEEMAAAAETAVDLLYRAGYDPRGLVTVFNRYAAEPRHSPYDSATIEKVVEHARSAIALYLPLRNPIVRSPTFLGIQKRISRL
jgi:predicted Zn-dependent protease